MINKLSLKLAKKFIKHQNLQYNKVEIYRYGFFVILSNLLLFLITIVIGIALDILLSSIVFYFSFFIIRQFAGGYHASTETKCEIISTISIFICLAIVRLLKSYDFRTPLLFIVLIAVISIALFCPLDTPEKPLSEKEFKYFRKISWVILFVITVTIVISYFFRLDILFAPCCMSLILESVLLIAGKIKQITTIKKMQSK